jgi:hypothetical protein
VTAFTLIDGEAAPSAACEAQAKPIDGRLCIEAGELERAFGWTLKDEGLCRGDVCVPLAGASLEREGGVDLERFAEALGRPLALDLDEGIALLGTGSAARGAVLASLEAPDFSLPDLAGQMHSLSEQRGKKVLLIAYASW